MGILKKLIFAVGLGLIILPAHGYRDDSPALKISESLEFFSSFARPQKVYLHIDKTEYISDETIWFKVYLFDGISHKLDTRTSNLYVELINNYGDAMDIKILLAEDGTAKGNISLSSDIPDGNYILRAYTDWMRNFGEDNYFSRHLFIKNPEYKNLIPRLDVLKNRRFNRQIGRMSQKYEIAFFPEGGNLVEGTNNRVAFKVVDLLGHGQDAKGEIIDDYGVVVASFETDFSGIGVIEIETERNMSYRARVTVNDGRPANYDFPEAVSEGFALRIDQQDEMINIRLVSSVQPGNPLYSEELIIVGHTRGIPHFGDSFRKNDGLIEANIDKSLFPSGITHFTVFNEKYVPVAERLIFIDRGDHLSFSPRIGTTRVDSKDYFDLRVIVSDKNGNPVAGNFSFSAVTDQQDAFSHGDDILSYILLSSDLRKMVKHPSAYLQNNSDTVVSADHLLLTYGWRRFNWGDVLAGDLPEIIFPHVSGLTLAGRLLDPAKNQPLRNYPVQLMVRSGHDDLFTTNTGRNGAFAFTGLLYEGEFDIELSSRRLPANYPPVFDLKVQGGREYDYNPGIFTRQLEITSRGDNWSRVRGVSRSPYASAPGMPANRQRYGTPDQTIFIDPESMWERSLFEVLRNRATGLNFEGGRITMRGQVSIYLRTEPRYMLDGVFVNQNDFLILNPVDIDRIEIFRGANTAVFGMRGSTGVILAYSRRPGQSRFEDVLELVIMGYHKPSEFYSDILSEPANSFLEGQPAKTVHWNPELISGQDGEFNVRFPLYPGINSLKLRVEGAGFEGGIGFAEFIVDIND